MAKGKRIYYQTEHINRNRLISEAEINALSNRINELIHAPGYQPMKQKEIAILLEIPKTREKELKKACSRLLSEGKATISSKGKFGIEGQFTNTGIFDRTQKGFGFVITEGEEDDIFIGEEDTRNAFSGDLVSYSLISSGNERGRKHATGRIVKILEHRTVEVAGRLKRNQNFAFLIPMDFKGKIPQDLYIHNEDLNGAEDGDLVLAKIVEYSTSPYKNPVGEVIEVLGKETEPGADILCVAKGAGLPVEFPDEVLMESDDLPDEVLDIEKIGRTDFRDYMTITIDGEDAKDLDDAITIRILENGNYELGVHIADVSHYVKEDSAIDREARKRGTSVYLINRVIPMLPEKLSNGICSLNANTDRLALSCICELNPAGEIVGHRIAETLIHVNYRMNYTDVACMLSSDEEHDGQRRDLWNKYPDLWDFLHQAEALSQTIRSARGERGAVDFDFPEAKVILDEETGKISDIHPYERNVATKMIEDFMLCANETIAEDAFWQDIPFLYRIHPEPDFEKMQQFNLFINHFGYQIHLKNMTLHPMELQKLIWKTEGSPYQFLIEQVMLRSMKKAKYSPENQGHFGLSAQYYTHFTSPIRRYPDLFIHRIIKENMHGGLRPERVAHYLEILEETALSTSSAEVRAEETERTVIKMKKCQYMADHIGECYDAVISGIVNWGFYCQLENTIEGLVRLDSMKDDYYTADPENYIIEGTRKGKTYLLGQKVRIKVVDTNSTLNTIDFQLIPSYNGEKGGE